jgi:membrane-bound lytic murein transglycosylase B
MSRPDALRWARACFTLWIAFTWAVAAGAQSQRELRPQVEAFIAEMTEKHGLARAQLRALMQQARLQRDILRAMSAQTTARPWHRYRPLYVNAERIAGGVRFWDTHVDWLTRAEREFGVPAEIIVATIGVETIYGTYTGTHRVLDALTTLAFDFPRRADFFRTELEQFLLLARDRVVDPLSIKGSYAGAIGIPQFLPSSYQRYAVDFDGNGRISLSTSVADAIGSVANYYRSFGWQEGRAIAVKAKVAGEEHLALAEQGIEPRFDSDALMQAGVTPVADIGQERVALLVLEGDAGAEHWLGLNNFYMITRYNRSVNYAMSVYQLAREIRAARDGRARIGVPR